MSPSSITTEQVSLLSQLWLPFLATIGASITVLAIQSLNRYIREQRKKIYGATYMADVLYRLLQAELIVQKHTICPHIEATKRMLAGDRTLLELALDTDEFDILSAGPAQFVQLPEEHKLLIGFEKLDIVQAFDTLLYLHATDSNRSTIRTFVTDRLKSKKTFLKQDLDEQHDILNTYWDILLELEHEGKRFIAFGVYVLSPMLREYSDSVRFKFGTTKAISEKLDNISSLQSEYKEFVPSDDFLHTLQGGGIQNAL